MNTLIPSIIRTAVPTLVGSFVAWVLLLGVTIDDDTKSALVSGLTGLLIVGYYVLARLLERKWPALSVLLGSSQMPVAYSPTGEPGANGPLVAPASGAPPSAPG